VSTRDSVPFNPRTGDDRIVLGVIASSEGPSAHDDDEVIRGLRVWAGRLEEGGISYTPRRIVEIHGRFGGHLTATVQLEVVHAGPQPAEAALAARRLVRGGANVLVGPTSPAALAAVSQFAARRRVLLLSIAKPPASAGRPRTHTWLTIPSADQLDGTLAMVRQRAVASGAPARIAILSAGGAWEARAQAAVMRADRRLVQARAYDAGRLGAGRALAAAARVRPAAIVTFAPLRQARAWFRGARGKGASIPWVLTAGDAAAAARELRSERVAVEVPWSPETPRTGRIFTNGHDFTAAYERAYGGLPPTRAIAGAALGLTLDAMVAYGRSTDPTRMLLVREQMNVMSIWGALQFHHGQGRTPTSQLVLVDHGRIRQIAPPTPPPSPAKAPSLLLRSSVPPGR
jgi:ABC-type branched-subunit amino acid transport system substrate-binding protein